MPAWTWKDKILDYEIETIKKVSSVYSRSWSWKDKILDYEIETSNLPSASTPVMRLEKIRFSITRLKLDTRLAMGSTSRPWKDKILDYEIETVLPFCVDSAVIAEAWKDKILDYEIETVRSASMLLRSVFALKR